jgi:hypothetical protein
MELHCSKRWHKEKEKNEFIMLWASIRVERLLGRSTHWHRRQFPTDFLISLQFGNKRAIPCTKTWKIRNKSLWNTAIKLIWAKYIFYHWCRPNWLYATCNRLFIFWARAKAHSDELASWATRRWIIMKMYKKEDHAVMISRAGLFFDGWHDQQKGVTLAQHSRGYPGEPGCHGNLSSSSSSISSVLPFKPIC